MDRMRKLRLGPILKVKAVTILPDKEITICATCSQAKIGTNEYLTLEKALYSIDSPEETTITLLSDVDLRNSTLFLGANTNITLDLAGHKITSRNCDGTIYLEGVLTIKDSSENGTGIIENQYPKGMGIYFNKTGVLRLEGGTIKGYSALYNWSDSSVPFVIMNGGTLNGSWYGISYLNAKNIIINNGIVQGGVMSFNNWDNSTHSFYIGESSYITKGALLHSSISNKYDATDNIVVVKQKYEIARSVFNSRSVS